MTIQFVVEGPNEFSKTVELKYPDDFEGSSGTITLTQADGILPGATYTVTETGTTADQTGYERTTTVTVGTGEAKEKE